MANIDDKLKKLADKYGIHSKEEFFQAFNQMERMNIGVFVTVFGKESDGKNDDDAARRGDSDGAGTGAYIHA